MRAICFIQEVKSGDLTMRQQILICRKALRKLRWPCVQELYAQAGTEDQPLSLRPGMVDLLRAAADGEADVLIVVDAEHLHCRRQKRLDRAGWSTLDGSSELRFGGVRWNARKKMCFSFRVSGCMRAQAAGIALLLNSSWQNFVNGPIAMGTV